MYRLIVDFGLVILVWMVQLIAYPNFYFLGQQALERWHVHYTKAITLIVMPLMLAQVGLHIWAVIQARDFLSWTMLILVVLIWLLTFLRAVPLHQAIANKSNVVTTIDSLLEVNAWRTFLWTLVFVLGLVQLKMS